MAKKSFKEQAKSDLSTKKVQSLFSDDGKKSDRDLGATPLRDAKEIPLDILRPDPNQPRQTFDSESLDELSESIRQKGIIQPLTVRRTPDQDEFFIITGERRYKAAKKAGLKKVPCIVKTDLEASEIFEEQLVENLQREDLAILDEVLGIQRLTNDYRKTQTQAAKVIGKTQGYVSVMLKILKLPQKILDEIPKTNPPKDFLFELTKLDPQDAIDKWGGYKKGQLNPKDVKKKNPEKPKIKPWTWQPPDKKYSISIKFKKQNPHKNEIIQALKTMLKELQE
jgi:ParB/RepB/Spo0J family partition protein